MFGIAGIIASPGQQISRPTLEAMTESLAHRGPDEEAYFVRGRVGLGHRRLRIIDLAGGHQPLSNEAGDVWVTYNGEIYNYRELRRALQASGHRFATNSDTEVIVHAYEEWAEDCIARLRGMFAIALWDAKRRRLLLASDRFGVKTLYYA